MPERGAALRLPAVLRDALRRARGPVPVARHLVVAADAARDAGHHLAAAMLYDEAVRLRPRRADLVVQAAHMYKEAGDYARAQARYGAALAAMPDDADLALQLGHFHRLTGRETEAVEAFARAARLKPGWPEAEREIAPPPPLGPDDDRTGASPAGLPVVRALLPRLALDPPVETADSLRIHRLGTRREHPRWGMMRTLAGVTAIRGVGTVAATTVELSVLLDGRTLHREAISPARSPATGARRAFPFNVWLDATPVPPGAYSLELRLVGDDGRTVSHKEPVAVIAPLREADAPGSDAVVTLDPGDDRSPEAQIRSRPSMIRPARRALLSRVGAVLVQRVDQLGDLVVSVPALGRIRALFPDARLVGLLSPANAGLGATLGLFDEIVVAEFAEDAREHRRVMSAADQQALAARLAPYAFDVAIDLSSDPASRPLLLLSGARFLHGFGGGDFPWLTSHANGQAHDPGNMLEASAQAGKLVALIDWLAAIATSRHEIVRRPGPDVVAPAVREPRPPYAVLHCGARLPFSRWPHYAALAALLLERTALDIVMLGMDAAAMAALPAELAGSARLRIVEGLLPFDAFDALLADAALFVGNDSGPKHLAALRGTRVVSIHMARLNWSEWGQEGDGVIVSRRVPCAGCAIRDDADACAKELACINDIRPEEVLAAIAMCLAEDG